MAHKKTLNWIPPGHETQYKNWIKKLEKSKRFRHARKQNKKNGSPTFEEWWERIGPSSYRLKAYMDFRAFHEKQKHDFTHLFYLKGFNEGCFRFFGINCCECCGEIIEDEQNPTAYEMFCEFEDEELKKLKQRTVH